MKKKTISLLFALVFLALCLAPSLGLALGHGSGAAANQVLAAKPRLLDREGRFNPDCLQELARYVDDRFALRQEAVTLWAALNAQLLRSSVTEDVLYGRDGWLYFRPTLPDYTRTQPMTQRELWCAARRLALLREYAEAQGGRFLFAIAPNKNSLYPGHMPALPREALPSNAEALAPLLAKEGVPYVDLFALFGAQDEELYYPRDTHWNRRGAALAADAGVSTPAVMAIGFRKKGLLIKAAYLAMEAVSDAEEASGIFCRPNARARVGLFIEDSSRLIASLHAAKIFHGNFSLSNFFYRGAVLSLWNPGWLQSWSGHLSERSILRDLSSLGAAVCTEAAKHRPSLDDFISCDATAELLLAAYSEVAPGWIPPLGHLVRAVEKNCTHRKRC